MLAKINIVKSAILSATEKVKSASVLNWAIFSKETKIISLIPKAFGVIESKNLLNILDENNLKKLSDEFLELAYNSGKWKKWLLDLSQTSDREKSIIAGHYVFSTPKCRDLKKEASQELIKKGIDLDKFLKESIKKSIIRYLRNFRLI